ncbi:probable inactive receptor kinase At1g27190 [Brachypodium distachyon]|uniref:Leucine-rich repeat-containing N-terminal plant-type domain-containing protein n=1 Tax=Brachypodium distachyon TaxID=15368 RepID=I1HU61_BRADI|nr:probable inactive receptor kinase At1g27190 [Brachypodium distachyon]XP_024314206.1 probable inactive receptor kinase At1g27190 [Brachypodium distachyon]KQK10989.1 hypothetical protein BRADI_2g57460v3 [Brachypodium distachyon]|eukprot:XP_010232678.1 probable inactive receptor kinase At1g27190 [Brachypodium distachyon]
MHGFTELTVWLLLLSSSASYLGHATVLDDFPDFRCLKELKRSLIDPNGRLESSWNFTDADTPGPPGRICRFAGVVCKYGDTVFGLSLGNLGLQGPFPRGLEHCSSMNSLDLSGNDLSGPLPEQIKDRMPPFLNVLDLSNNSFSGGIPAGIGEMSYLRELYLQHNQLDGRIPGQLIKISWLRSFSVAGNSLSGPIPGSLQLYPCANFTGNLGLWGAPLDRECGKRPTSRNRIDDSSSVGAAVGFVVGFVVAFYFSHWFICCGRFRPYIVPVCTARDASLSSVGLSLQ